jgi:hypothetical protein
LKSQFYNLVEVKKIPDPLAMAICKFSHFNFKYTKIALTILLFQLSLIVSAQQGLFLSGHSKTEGVKDFFRIENSGWYQIQADKHSAGLALVYCPYFSKSKSELRIKVGRYGTNDKFNKPEDLTYYMLSQGSPSYEVGVGYTKLFSEEQPEFAFNADLYYTNHSLSIRDTSYSSNGHKKVNLGTYHIRTGVEIIPIKGKLSFYANANFLVGVSGKSSYDQLRDTPSPLLQQAEYIDAGFRGMFGYKCFKIIPDMNLIFTEKRMSDIIQDTVIPTFKINLVFLIPIKN